MGGGTWLRRLGWGGTWDWGPPRPCATLLPPIMGFTFYGKTQKHKQLATSVVFQNDTHKDKPSIKSFCGQLITKMSVTCAQ